MATCAALVTHHDAVGCRPASKEADAAQQVAVRDAGGREKDLLTRRQVVRVQDGLRWASPSASILAAEQQPRPNNAKHAPKAALNRKHVYQTITNWS